MAPSPEVAVPAVASIITEMIATAAAETSVHLLTTNLDSHAKAVTSWPYRLRKKQLALIKDVTTPLVEQLPTPL